MSGGFEFLFWLVYFALLLLVSGLWAVAQFLKSRKSDVLPPPRMDRIARGGRDAWEITVTNNGEKHA